ncbi:striatin [Schizosaccharomyces japonicus yFS275]|uniref:Striatin n=1 Tax=Schizosaccharomyces japonicus (strain yFS275 / FY16936) TaxID=402676 RepID=B6K2P8_SCHJY|nr:striatin [Schizosaccharomyces japonicus yFS275]EEB07429.2 striatin [Schizosaccharomyces japonicus yFS275]
MLSGYQQTATMETGISDYTLPRVIRFLQGEHFRIERERNLNEIEKTEMRRKIASLETDNAKLRQLVEFHARRTKMLENAIRRNSPTISNNKSESDNEEADELSALFESNLALQSDNNKLSKVLEQSKNFIKKCIQEITYMTNIQPQLSADSYNSFWPEEFAAQNEQMIASKQAAFNCPLQHSGASVNEEVPVKSPVKQDNEDAAYIHDDLIEDEIFDPAAAKQKPIPSPLKNEIDTTEELTPIAPSLSKNAIPSPILNHSWKTVCTLTNSSPVRCLAYESFGSSVPSFAYGDDNGQVKFYRIFDSNTSNEFPTPAAVYVGHKGSVLSLCFPTNIRRIFSSGSDGCLRAWKLPSLHPSSPSTESPDNSLILDLDGNPIKQLLVFEDKNKTPSIMSLCLDNSIRAWKLTGEEITRVTLEKTQPECMSIYDTRLVVSWSDGYLRMYDLETFNVTHTIAAYDEDEPSSVTHVLLMNENKIMTLHTDGALRIFDVVSQKLVHKQSISKTVPTTASFSNNGQELAIGDLNGTVQLFALMHNELTHKATLSTHSGSYGTGVSSLLWTKMFPDGKEYLLSAGLDGRVHVYCR